MEVVLGLGVGWAGGVGVRATRLLLVNAVKVLVGIATLDLRVLGALKMGGWVRGWVGRWCVGG